MSKISKHIDLHILEINRQTTTVGPTNNSHDTIMQYQTVLHHLRLVKHSSNSEKDNWLSKTNFIIWPSAEPWRNFCKKLRCYFKLLHSISIHFWMRRSFYEYELIIDSSFNQPLNLRFIFLRIAKFRGKCFHLRGSIMERFAALTGHLC